MITIKSPYTKTLLLLTLTTLTIGLGASVSIDSPTSGDIQDVITINATNNENADWIYFEVDGPNSDNDNKTNLGGNDASFDYTAGNGDYGDYTITVEDSTGSTDTVDVTIDGGNPSIDLSDDTDFVSSEATLTFDISDDITGIEDVEGSASDSDILDESEDCDGDEDCEIDFDLDTDGLDEEDEIDITVSAEDGAGNTAEFDQSFTFDSEWDGDSSAGVEWDESGSNVLTGFGDEDQDVLVSLEGDSVSDTTVECWVDGDEVDSDSGDASDEETDFDCRLDHEDYSSSRFELTVEASDEAGNTETVVDEKQMIWDVNDPFISSLEQNDGVSTFNSGFSLNVVSSDDASGIESLEYYFNSGTDSGDGTSISLDESNALTVEKEFRVDPSSLGQGNHTVYVRSEDSAGNSVVESFDFEYYPDREPEVSLDSPETVEVVSGSSESFSLGIGNDSPFFLSNVDVGSSSDNVWSGSKTVSGLKEGETSEKTVTVDASNLDPGTYNLVLETASTGDSKEVQIIIRANDEQKQTIEAELREWDAKRKQLDENISDINTLESSNDNITRFTSKVASAQSAVENGEYYNAESSLTDIESDFNQALDTYSERKMEHEKQQREKLFMIVFGTVVLLGGSVIGLLVYRDENPELEKLKQSEVFETIRNKLPEDLNVDLPTDKISLEKLPEGVRDNVVVDKVKEILDKDDSDKKDIGYSFEDFT